MLSEDQIIDVWERRISAEVRSLYFAELTTQYSRVKQWITFTTIIFSLGAAISIIGKSPVWIPTTLSILAAGILAYTAIVGFDRTTRLACRLFRSWSELTHDYQNLTSHTHTVESSSVRLSLMLRERELLEGAGIPENLKRLAYWQDYVLRQRRLVPA